MKPAALNKRSQCTDDAQIRDVIDNSIDHRIIDIVRIFPILLLSIIGTVLSLIVTLSMIGILSIIGYVFTA